MSRRTAQQLEKQEMTLLEKFVTEGNERDTDQGQHLPAQNGRGFRGIVKVEAGTQELEGII